MPANIQDMHHLSSQEIKMNGETHIESDNQNLGNGKTENGAVEDSSWEANANGLSGQAARSIYKVPEGLHQAQGSAFVPRLISIGPLHHNDQKFKAMERYKTMYLEELLDESPRPATLLHSRMENTRMVDLDKAMEDLLKRAWASYQPKPNIQGKDFIEMMKLDGCFIIQLLRKFHQFQTMKEKAEMNSQQQVKGDHTILRIRWMLRTLQRDMIMLENQLPYEVLEKIFAIMCPRDKTPLETLVMEFFKPLFPKDTVISEPADAGGQGFDHMLHLFYKCLLSKEVSGRLKKTQEAPKEAEYTTLVHCACNLNQAGVEVKRKTEGKLLEIVFDGKALFIPPLFIGDDSVIVLMNFLAFEQCHHELMPFFTSYFFFMDSLINSKEDVEVLHEQGIINHVLGSDKAVCELVNNVSRQIVHDPEQCYLRDAIQNVNAACNAYYQNNWLKWWRNLMSKYFSNPWSFMSLAAAIFLLILTVVQTFYAVYAYYVSDAYLLGGHWIQLKPSYGSE